MLSAIKQAVKDRAILSLLYEGRDVHMHEGHEKMDEYTVLKNSDDEIQIRFAGFLELFRKGIVPFGNTKTDKRKM